MLFLQPDELFSYLDQEAARGDSREEWAKGDHEIWINISFHTRTTIPNWGSEDLKPGTISKTLRD